MLSDSWFQGEIDALRGRIAQLESQASQFDAAAIASLQSENEQLKTQLQQTQARLEGIQNLLGNGATPPVPAPSEAAIAASATQFHQPIPTRATITHRQAEERGAALDPDALRAVQVVMDYNDQAATHNEKWAISIPVMKGLLRQVGKATQPKIEAVLRAKAQEIEQHHRQHGLGGRHNRVHQGQSISDLVKL